MDLLSEALLLGGLLMGGLLVAPLIETFFGLLTRARLLELAAAQREQRQQEIRERALDVAPEPAAQSAVAATAGAATPAPAAAPAAADEAAPQLGAFDADFTWSAEVLAAQGRQLEDISLEEIDWLGRLRRGMEKTRRGFVTQLLDTLGDDPLTPEVLDDLEGTLLRADVGVQATDQVLEALRKRLREEQRQGEGGQHQQRGKARQHREKHQFFVIAQYREAGFQ